MLQNLMRIFILLCMVLNGLICDDVAIVTLDQGQLSGKVEETFAKKQSYLAFKGIPYAEPPIGDLRFIAPKPHNGWNGIYEAHETKETCMQYSGRMRNNEPFGISGSEDCLYLSIYTPSTKGSLPIIVFDYNDHFRTSFNGTETYAPDFFMENDVIIVTISHRLGLFGYLSTEDQVSPGNAGLKDYVLGLEWIKNNLHNFGGNPAQVTLMGNRGGAAIADILLYSERSTGLFGGVILQSGTSLETVYFRNNPREVAFKLGKVMNITTDSSEELISKLREIDGKDLLLKESDLVDSSEVRDNQMTVLLFTPIIEHDHPDAILKSLPDETKVINDVPVIIGFNSREGVDLAQHYIFEPRLVVDADKEFLLHFPIRSAYKFNKDSSVYAQVEKEVKEFYFKDGEFTVYNTLEYANYVGDMLQVYASDVAARKIFNEISSPIYYYLFDFRGGLNENLEHISKSARTGIGYWGATITDELCYLFLCARIHKTYEELNELPSEQKEMKTVKKMVRMWTNFAKSRNPTPKDDKILRGLVWEPINDINNRKYLHISNQFKMDVNPLYERMKFWDQFLLKYSNKAINGIVTDHDEL